MAYATGRTCCALRARRTKGFHLSRREAITSRLVFELISFSPAPRSEQQGSCQLPGTVQVRHDILFGQLKEHIDDPPLLDVLWEYMRRKPLTCRGFGTEAAER